MSGSRSNPLRLSRVQWLVVLQSPFVLLLTWARLRRDGLGETLARLDAAVDAASVDGADLTVAKGTARALKLAIRISPWKPKCLVRSLALGWYLSRKCIPFVVCIGAASRETGDEGGGNVNFRAHAWVECGGVVLNDRQDVAEYFAVFEDGPDSA